MPAELMTPTQAAKKLGVTPQKVYGWVKNGRVTNHASEGETASVDLEDVKRAAMTSTTRGPNGSKRSAKGSKKGVKSPAKKYDVMSWPKKTDRAERRVVQVTGSDSQLTYLRDSSGREFEFRNTSLKELIAKGTVRIEEPWAMLRCVALSIAKAGDRDTAKSLANWIMEHEPKKVEEAVPEQEVVTV